MLEDCWWCMTEHEKIACKFQLRSFVKNWFNSLWCCNVVVNFQLWNIKVCVLGTTSDSIYWTNHCAQRPVWIKWFHFQTQSPPWHLPLLSTQTSSHLWASDWRYKVKIVDMSFFEEKNISGVSWPPRRLGRSWARTSTKTISPCQWLIWCSDKIILMINSLHFI